MARTKPPTRPAIVSRPCTPCKGSGEVPITVRVGRKHRVVGKQTGICLACFGTGKAPIDKE
ncbi:hypothetical protein ACFWY6_06725 [Streptomyces sp. NPDC059037]|uniref:hypothetical protein n=1 Tax=Streptomyces sp. NPDC059037 TaxID=3346710 RepID=UPI0036BF5614